VYQLWLDTVPLRALLLPYRYVRYAFTLARPSTWIGLALQLDDITNNQA
jgi:hypothetical protein